LHGLPRQGSPATGTDILLTLGWYDHSRLGIYNPAGAEPERERRRG